MLKISTFLENIKLDENIKSYLKYVWEEIEIYLKRLEHYSKESLEIFLQDYLIKETVNSNKIENALYSFDAVHLYNDLLRDKDIDERILKKLNKLVRTKDKIIDKENYINSFKNISYEQYLENEKWNLEGNYRKNVVWLGSSNDMENAIHIPPKPEEIEEYMHDFFDYLNNSNYLINEDLKDPIIKSVLLHMIFIKIHPFGNGNGRTARILLNNNLRIEINKKYNLKFLYPPINLSMSFDASKQTYNEKQNNIIFKEGVDNNQAINSWIKYNLIAIEEQLFYINSRLDHYDNFFKINGRIK